MGLHQFGIPKLSQLCCTQSSSSNNKNNPKYSNPHQTNPTNPINLHLQQLIDYKRFQQQTWFRFKKQLNFDPIKFIFLYPNYDSQQTKLIRHWRNIDMKNAQYGRMGSLNQVKSERWQFAIRKGVPIIYIKAIIGVIFNRNFQMLNVKANYDKLLREHKIQTHNHQKHFKNISLSDLPVHFVKQYKNIKLCVFAPFLNNNGFRALSNILSLLTKTRPRIKYNPYLLNIIAIMLIFFQQQETYDIVTIMIDNSICRNDKQLQALRWHFTFKQEHMESLAQSFYTFLGSKSGSIKRLIKYWDSKKIDKLRVFKTILEDFFYGFLPFKIILKVFLIFLNEGMKFIFRLIYALLKGGEQHLKQCQTVDKVIIVLRKRWICCSDELQYQTLLKTAYNITLQKYVTTKIQQSFCQSKEHVIYYIPFIRGESDILTFDDLQTIWNQLPQQIQHYDLEKTFPPTNKSKFSNNRNYYEETLRGNFQQPTQVNQKYKDFIDALTQSEFTLLIVRSMNQSVFGVFFAKSLQKDKEGYGGHSENFLIQLFPNKQKISSTGNNVFYLIQKPDCIEVGGGGEGPSLRIHQSLEYGASFTSETYNNPPLHSGQSGEFKIQQIEVFALF